MAFLVNESGILRVCSAGGDTSQPHAGPGHKPLASLYGPPRPFHTGPITPVLTRTPHTLTVAPIGVQLTAD